MEIQLKKLKFFIFIKIVSYETCKEKTFPFSKFTEYTIKIFTNDKTWELNRRYSNFYELHKKLSKRFTNLPKLPPKKIFKTDSVIKERQEKLEKYLNLLLNREDIYKFDEIFEFIEMEKEYYLMLKKNIEEDSTFDTSIFSSGISDKVKSLIRNNLKKSKSYENEVIIKENFFYSECNSVRNFNGREQIVSESDLANLCDNKNDRKYSVQLQNSNFNNFAQLNNERNFLSKVVSSFLKDLNKKVENRCEVVKNFEKTFYNENSKFCFNSEHAYKILFGELNTEKNVSRNDRYMFGLIHHTGTIDENRLGAESALEFLSKLIDCQYNFNSEFFVCLIKSANVSEIIQMNLERHLTNKKSNVTNAVYKVLEVILDSDGQSGIKFDYLIKNAEFREHYFNWVVNRFL